MKTYALIATLLVAGALALWWVSRPQDASLGAEERPRAALPPSLVGGSGPSLGAAAPSKVVNSEEKRVAGSRSDTPTDIGSPSPEDTAHATSSSLAGRPDGVPPAEARPDAVSPSGARPGGVSPYGARRDGEGLTEVVHPDGTVTLDLRGRFRATPVAVQDEDGNVRIEER